MNIFVVLPAYNESQNIRSVLEKILRLNIPGVFNRGQARCSVILVNDGSTDDTVSEAKNSSTGAGLMVENHPRNMGLGPALRTGLRKSLSIAGEDLVVVMDADNSHDPALIPAMAEKILEGYDVVIASRYCAGGRELGLSYIRKLLSRCCSSILGIFFPIKNVRDYTCGYRMYGVTALRKLSTATGGEFFREDGFVCMSELIISLSALGAKIAEVPLVLRYDLKKGQSKMKIGRTIYRYIALTFRLKSGSVQCL